MTFNSLTFLYFFLPFSLFAYYLFPLRFRNVILLISSLVFYAWVGVSFLLLLIFSSLVNFLFFSSIQKNDSPKIRNRLFITGIIFNILYLFSFKYLPQILSTSGMDFPDVSGILLNNIILPLGISYYTFKAISSLVYINGPMQNNKVLLLEYMVYITMFQQITAGPIDRFQLLGPQIQRRNTSPKQFISGIKWFALGLFKKVIISGPLGLISSQIFTIIPENLSQPIAWLGAITYTLQVYYDFSGYTDMAIGLGKFYGFEFSENFNFPLSSRSIKEFWRRWHISLSTWLRDYFFQPLAYSLNMKLNKETYLGFRKSDLIYYLTTILTFVLCGVWHGATWPFVIWGLIHGLLLSFEKTNAGKWICTRYKVLGHLYFLFFVLITFVIFSSNSISSSKQYLGTMFGFGSAEIYWLSLAQYIDYETSIVYAIAILGATSFFQNIHIKLNRLFLKTNPNVLSYSYAYQIFIYFGIVLTLIISSIFIVAGTTNSFLYFKF